MGGDYAPKEVVLGSVAACRELGAEVILVGDEAAIKKELAAESLTGLKLEIEPASEVIGMGEHPANAVKHKKDSSLVVANRLVKEGKAGAVISAGNSGAAMTASLLVLGRINNVKRPALASPMPTKDGVSILLDAGANADCDAENLLQFAMMGSIYAELVLGLPHPRIGLLSIGEEETKGNKLILEAHQLLKASGLNFIGNIEGIDVHRGACEVIVCDGFVGNIVLKLSEGLATVLFGWVKEAITANLQTKLGGLMVKGSMKKLIARMDYSEYGGVPLLGVNGLSLIGHGRSNAKAIKSAIRAAMRAADQDLVGKIASAVK